MTTTELKLGRLRPVEDLEDISTISERVRSGRAILRAVAYPWGVELDVFDSLEGLE